MDKATADQDLCIEKSKINTQGDMIKFRIHPKSLEERGANLRKCWENVKVIGFLYFLGHFR